MPRPATGQVTKRTNAKTGKVTFLARWKTAEGGTAQKSFPTISAARVHASKMTVDEQARGQTITQEEHAARTKQNNLRRMTMTDYNQSFDTVVAMYTRAIRNGYDGGTGLRSNTIKGYKKHHTYFAKFFKERKQHDHWEWHEVPGTVIRDLLISAVHLNFFSRSTAKAKFDELKRVYKFALSEGYVHHDQTAGLRIKMDDTREKTRSARVKREAAYRPDEVKALISAADSMCADTTLDPRNRRSWNDTYRTLLHVLVSTGIRIGEARALTRDDIDFEKCRIHVSSAADYGLNVDAPKSANAVRTIRVRQDVIDRVRHTLSKHRHNLVFASANGTPRADNALRDYFLKPLCKKAGVKQRGFHGFRHHFASRHIMARTDLMRVSRLLGHHSVAFTLDTYGHFFDEMADNEPPDFTI